MQCSSVQQRAGLYVQQTTQCATIECESVQDAICNVQQYNVQDAMCDVQRATMCRMQGLQFLLCWYWYSLMRCKHYKYRLCPLCFVIITPQNTLHTQHLILPRLLCSLCQRMLKCQLRKEQSNLQPTIALHIVQIKVCSEQNTLHIV